MLKSVRFKFPTHKRDARTTARPDGGGAMASPTRTARLLPKVKDWLRRHWMFHVLVLVPTLLAAVYFGLIASDLYISESRFVIRQPEKKTLSSLGQFLQSAGMTSSQSETFTIRDYMLSRDALKILEDNLKLRHLYSSPHIDFLSRFNPLNLDDSFEDFFKYYGDIVTIDLDTASSICILKVRAYTPKLARGINEALLFLGEGLVNELNDRARQDLIHFAAQEVEEAEKAAKTAALALSDYRNRKTLFDPSQQSSMQLQQVGKLQADLIDVRGQLAQLRAFVSESPFIKALEKRASELQKAINTEMGKVTGGADSMTQKVIEYERLSLEREFTEKRLAAALASLQEARAAAQRQQLYLEKIVNPNLPDKAQFPRRGRDVVLVFVVCWLVYAIVRLLKAGVEEHKG